ncbi:MAG TPA: DNA mismatch repair endonuclease MutL [Pirellulales bacterium]|jgi:DNA mismatch repair protein MutL|nr:DNA mismatch repair endonuclease MutL [Pirellulales bacterium]
MAEIRQLPPSVVNKIAAGEVIERPASVVKELMENSIDAGATRIDVTVEQGGLELVRVSDDGAGMAADQLPLAVASHATSKIQEADDLFCVQTLGFRGEALASIAEVSRLVLRSRTRSADAGAQLEVSGGHSAGVAPCGCPVGTTVEIRQLFYNTPVRRKFLRSTQTEMGHISEAFTRVALANPKVHCSLGHNGRPIYDLPGGGDWRGRIAAFFGDDLAGDLIAVASNEDAVHLSGFVASPSHSRANPRLQYLFLNGRAIRDRSLQHALGEAYRGLLMTGRYAIAFLRIEMPPEMIDVNVHPTKLEVRFQEAGRLYSQLLGTLRTKFLSTDLTSRLQPAAESEAAAAVDPARAEQIRRELVDWAKGQLAGMGADVNALNVAGSQEQMRLEEQFRAPRAPLELSTLERRWEPVGDDDEHEKPAETRAEHRLDGGTSFPSRPLAALQLHNRYLITESDDGMVVIDQHALHERILYEYLREKVLGGTLESQALLVPEPVDLSPAEAAAVLGARDLLGQLGVAVEPFGGDTVLVSGYPAMLANLRPSEVLHDLVEQLLSGGKTPERRDVLDSLLHMISCKAAIKAGDRLSGEEIAALLEQRHLARDSHHCPHGRPTALFFSREELDKQFKRT